jgi:hypothetical protein
MYKKHFDNHDKISLIPNTLVRDKIIKLLRKEYFKFTEYKGKIIVNAKDINEIQKILRQNNIGVFLKCFDPKKSRELKFEFENVNLNEVPYTAKVSMYKRFYKRLYNETPNEFPDSQVIDEELNNLYSQLKQREQEQEDEEE